MVEGKVVSFDRIKGYRFLAADSSGEDVFVHANDLLDDKALLTPGSLVEFLVDDGDRGLKASDVRVIRSMAPVTPQPAAGRTNTDSHDPSDVMSVAQFEREVIEMFLRAEPSLNGAQMLDLRKLTPRSRLRRTGPARRCLPRCRRLTVARGQPDRAFSSAPGGRSTTSESTAPRSVRRSGPAPRCRRGTALDGEKEAAAGPVPRHVEGLAAGGWQLAIEVFQHQPHRTRDGSQRVKDIDARRSGQ